MKRFPTLLALPLFLFTLLCAAPVSAEETAASASDASSIVKDFYTTLQSTMKDGPALGFDGRYKKLEPAVTKAFNLPLMTRYAVGLAWSKASADEQAKLVKAFSNFSVATYASRFTKSDGEVFEVLGEKPAAGGGVMVETRLTPKDSDPVTLNYLVRKDETGALRIVDVYLDAAISELATRRAEFGSVVKREGLPALLASLIEKAKKMGLSISG